MLKAIRLPLGLSSGKIHSGSPRGSCAARRIAGPRGSPACGEWATNNAPHHQQTALCSWANALRLLRQAELKKLGLACHAIVERERAHLRVQTPTARRKSGRPRLRLQPKLAMRAAGFQK